MDDVLHVVVESQGDPLWLTLLGNGGVGIFLGALIGMLVSRLGRSREDRRDWQQLGHEKYSEFVLLAHEVISMLAEGVARNRLESSKPRWKQRAMRDVDESWRPLSDKLYEMSQLVSSLNLLAHGQVRQGLEAVTGIAHAGHGFLIQNPPHQWQDFENEQMSNLLKDLAHDLAILEDEMRKQLNIKTGEKGVYYQVPESRFVEVNKKTGERREL